MMSRSPSSSRTSPQTAQAKAAVAWVVPLDDGPIRAHVSSPKPGGPFLARNNLLHVPSGTSAEIPSPVQYNARRSPKTRPTRKAVSPVARKSPRPARNSEVVSMHTTLDESTDVDAGAASEYQAVAASYKWCREELESGEASISKGSKSSQGAEDSKAVDQHLQLALADVTNRFCSATQAVVTAAEGLSDAADEAQSNALTVRATIGILAIVSLGLATVPIFDIDNTARTAFAGGAVAAGVVALVVAAVFVWGFGVEQRWCATKLASRAVNQILDDEVLVLRSRSRGNRAWMGLARLVQDISSGLVDGRYVKSVVLPKGERMSWDEVRLIGRMASTTRMRLREAETTFGRTIEWPEAREEYAVKVDVELGV